MGNLYLSACHVTESLLCEANMLLQLLLDRVLLAINVKECHTAALVQEREDVLTLREQNVIRYMAGYVIQKLKKRFKKR